MEQLKTIMSSYKLTYFDGEARAGVSRLLFALSNIPYKDIRVSGEEWQRLKQKTPFGQMPILEVDGETICQSKAIEFFIARRTGKAGITELEQTKALMIADCMEDVIQPIFKTMFMEDKKKKKEILVEYNKNQLPGFMCKFEKMLEKSSGDFFLGQEITWPDIVLFQFTTSFLPGFDHVNVNLCKYPKLQALTEKVKACPNIAAYLQRCKCKL